MSGHPDPVPRADSLATRASLLGRLKNWEDARSWEEFTQIYSRLIRAVARKAGGDTDTTRDFVYTDWNDVRAFAEGFGRCVSGDVATQSDKRRAQHEAA